MRISDIAFANLKRRKGKAIFLAVGIAIGIGTVVALTSLSGSIRKEIGAQLDQFGANIVVVPRSDSMSVNYGGVAVSTVSFDEQYLTQADAARILEIPYNKRLAVVAPKLLGGASMEGRTVLLAGVNFASELKLKRWWRLIGRPPESEHEVLVGYDLAKALSLVDGESVESHRHALHSGHASPSAPVDSPASSRPSARAVESGLPAPIRLVANQVHIGAALYSVAGVILPTGGSEDRMVFATLGTAQSLLKQPDRLSLIEVSALCKDCPVGDIVFQIGQMLPHAKVSAVQQTVRAREQAVDRLTRFSSAVSAVVLGIGGLLIFTTMTGSVVERTREIGVFRAIGFRKSHIARCLLVEVAVVSSVGGLLGWALGSVVGWVSLPFFAETDVPYRLDVTVLAASIGGALALGLLSSLFPIYRASRLDPLEAVRYV